jgi:hypothetical protein
VEWNLWNSVAGELSITELKVGGGISRVLRMYETNAKENGIPLELESDFEG